MCWNVEQLLSCCNCPENAGFPLWAEISAAVNTGSPFSSQVLSQSQRFCSCSSPSCWAFRVDFLSLLCRHDNMHPNPAEHHCQALFSSKTGLKFGHGEIHTFSLEAWLPCWELHLLSLEGLHDVLVAGLCFVFSKIFSASAVGYQLSCCVSYMSLLQSALVLSWAWCFYIEPALGIPA